MMYWYFLSSKVKDVTKSNFVIPKVKDIAEFNFHEPKGEGHLGIFIF